MGFHGIRHGLERARASYYLHLGGHVSWDLKRPEKWFFCSVALFKAVSPDRVFERFRRRGVEIDDESLSYSYLLPPTSPSGLYGGP